MCFHLTNLDDEWMRTKRLVFAPSCGLIREHKLRDDNSIVGGATQSTVPPLRCCQCWTVQNKLLCGLVLRGSCLNAANIASVAKLGLGISPDDLLFQALLELVVTLGLVCLLHQSLPERGVQLRALRSSNHVCLVTGEYTFPWLGPACTSQVATSS